MKNKMILFTGPSGVGKSTIEEQLFNDKSLHLSLSISATTRKPRENEENGKHYYFLSPENFDKKIQNNEFVEWNSHFSNKYGTLKTEIDRIQKNGEIPFIEVEVNGAKNIIKNYGANNLVSIFIAPPSLEKLRERIIARGTENELQINERLSRVEEEMQYKDMFDHVVVNDDLKKTISLIKEIIKGGK